MISLKWRHVHRFKTHEYWQPYCAEGEGGRTYFAIPLFIPKCGHDLSCKGCGELVARGFSITDNTHREYGRVCSLKCGGELIERAEG